VHGLDHPVLLDHTGEYARRLGVHGVPMNILVDQRGMVRAVGATTPEEIRAALTTLFTGP
jgi:predicted DsbA family dithiol-disulfide isomerase